MEKKISAEEFVKDIINIAELLKERSEKKQKELDSPMFIVDLSTIEQETHSLYMQKMSDMTKEQLEELLSEVSFKLLSLKSINILDEIKKIDGNKLEEELEPEMKFLKRLSEEVDTSKKDTDIQMPEDLDFNYIEGTIKKLVKTIQQIKPEYYPIYYGELVHTDTVNLVNYYYSKQFEEEDIDFPHYLFLPVFSHRKFVKNIEEIKYHYEYVMLKPINYEVIYIALFVEILLDYIELSFQEKFTQKMIKFADKDEIQINFKKLDRLVNSLIELYIDFITGKKSLLITNEFSKFLTKARKFLEQNYKRLLEIVEEVAKDYYEKLVDFNETLISQIGDLEKEILKSHINVLSDVKNNNIEMSKGFINLAKEIQIYGLEGLDYEDLVLKYDSDDIYSLLLSSMVLASENELYEETEYILEKVKFLIDKLPYISKNYDYEYINTITKLIALENPDKETSLENIKPEFRHLWLKYLYKTEQYEEFIKFFNEVEKVDRELTDEMKEYEAVYLEFAKYYTNKITKENLIEFLQELSKIRKKRLKIYKVLSKPLMYALNEENDKLEKYSDDLYLEDLFELINIYPYNPKPYEILEIEFDYKSKQKRV